MTAPGPLAQPPLPPVRRLSRAVWIAIALLACITVFVVLFLATPRKGAQVATPAPKPLAGTDPTFLQHPAGDLPAAPPPALSEQEYLRRLAAHQPPGAYRAGTGGPGAGRPFDGTPDGYPPAAGLAEGEPAADAAGAYRPPFSTRPTALPPPDPRRESFARALTAPLSRAPLPPAPHRDPESESLARWLAPLRASAPSPLSPPPASPADLAAWPGPAAAPASALGPNPAGDPRLPATAPALAGASASFATAGTPFTSGRSATATTGSPLATAGSPLATAGSPLSTTYSPPATAGSPFAPAGSPFAASSPLATTRPAPAAAAPFSSLPLHFHPRPTATTLPAGTVIPALLLTAVNSGLPGSLLAQVTRDVYDFRQERILLPASTRLLGRYDSQVALGQSRLLVAWTRVVLPDGSGFDLPGLPGLPAVDANGAAGLAAHVSRHLLRTFGDALLLSLLSAGAQLSQPQPAGFATTPSAGNVAAAALGQELSAAGLELLHRDISIQPTLSLPPATPFLVFVNGDLDLAPLFAGVAGVAGVAGAPSATVPPGASAFLATTFPRTAAPAHGGAAVSGAQARVLGAVAAPGAAPAHVAAAAAPRRPALPAATAAAAPGAAPSRVAAAALPGRAALPAGAASLPFGAAHLPVSVARSTGASAAAATTAIAGGPDAHP